MDKGFENYDKFNKRCAILSIAMDKGFENMAINLLERGDKIEMKICPIREVTYHSKLECLEQDCAWYDKFNKRCAVLSIAKEMQPKR